MFLATRSATAQDTTGRVIGTITDQQGAAVPDANVTVTNTSTQHSSTTSTREDGTFEVVNLPVGLYRVEVQHAGFNKVATQPNRLEINQSLRFDVVLTLGAVSQTVTVESQTTRVETENPTVGATVTGEAIQDAPLNGRNVLDLAKLQPGVTESNPDNTGAGTYSIAGGRTDSVTFLLDGSLNNDLLDNGVVFNPNPETIAEFRILESNYSAEYGRNGGGIITEVTKSGTNQWHGSAYDYLRNGDLDANSFFNHLDGNPRDPLRRNQYGASFGGPIDIPRLIDGRNRFFFFVAYQGQKQSDLTTPLFSQVNVLTPAEVASGDFSQAASNGGPDPGVTCFLTGFFQNTQDPNLPDGTGCGPVVGAVHTQGTPHPFFQNPIQPAACAALACALDPTKFNPVSLNYINDGLMPVSPTGLLTPTSSTTDDRNELTMRFDFQVTPKDQITATLGGQRNPTLDPFVTASNLVPWADVPGFSTTTKLDDYFLNLGYTHIFSVNVLNEVRFATQRLSSKQGDPVGPNAANNALSLGFANLTPDNPTGPPLVAIDAQATTIGYTFAGPTTLVNNTFGVSDTLTWIRGKHTWKMGAGVSAYQNNQLFDFITNGVFDFNGTITGNGFADFLLGAATDYTQGSAAPSNIRTKSWYGFVQDEWKVTKNFTLSLGLRYEYNSPKLDTLGRTFSIVPGDISARFPGAPVGVVFPGDRGAPRGVNFPDRDNFAPRFGFAWNPDGHGKTSIRGGFGIFYDILKAEDNFQFNGQPPFFSLANFSFPIALEGNSCAASNQSAQIVTYFSDPFDSSCNVNTFPSVEQLSGPQYFSTPGSTPFGPQLFFVDPHLHTPYTYQYNLSVQREIVPSLVFELNYLGSSSHGLTALQDINPFVLGTTDHPLNLTPGNSTCQDQFGNSTSGASPDALCSLGALLEFRNIVDANYNAVTASLTKQVGNSAIGHVYFTFGYTYGHSIDNASGFRQRSDQVPSYNPELLRASSDTDVRNRITFSGGWDLPFDRAWASGPKRLTQGWTLFPIVTWRSGFPLNILAQLSDTGSFAEGPSGAGDALVVNANVIGSTKTLNPRSNGLLWFNPASFTANQSVDNNPADPNLCNELSTEPLGTLPSDTQGVLCPALRTYGSFRRNSMPGPGLVNFDMSVSKTTAITERLKLEIRGDFFNILNHAEFENPDTNILDPPTTTPGAGGFGQISNTFAPRIIQLAARFSF
jgi:hypothetical protein